MTRGSTGNRNVRSYVRGGTQVYRAEVSIEGKKRKGRYRRTLEEALKDRAQLETLQSRAMDPGVSVVDPTLRDAWEQVQNRKILRGARAATLTYYTHQWRYLTNDLGWDADFSVAAIDEGQVRRWVQKLLASGCSQTTVWQKRVQFLRQLLKHAMAEGWISQDPTARLVAPKVRQVRYKYMLPEEIEDLVERMRCYGDARTETRDAAIVEFLFRTGLRKAELCALKPEDIDRRGPAVHVEEGKIDYRTVPLSERALEMWDVIEEIQGSKAPVLSYPTVGLLARRWQERLEEPRLSPHVLRHSFATRLVQQKVPVYDISQLLGHKSLTMTLRYLRSNDLNLRSAVEGL